MRKFFLIFILVFIFGAACADGEEEASLPTLVPTAVLDSPAAAATSTPVPPTATPVPPTPTPQPPLAAEVNGRPITLAAFEAELARYEQGLLATGQTLDQAPDRADVVLRAMVERQLILGAADAAGIVVSEADVDAEMALLRAAAGEEGNFAAWLTTNGWTEAAFREEVRASLLQEQIVAQVTGAVPAVAEQVRVRYIQVDDQQLADTLAAQLQNGDDFATLAQLHSLDRVTGEVGGDLGFFGRGVLLVPEVEAAAFALQAAGEISPVVSGTSSDGQVTYYLVQLIERDPARPLPPEQLLLEQQNAFYSWLDALWADAVVVEYIEQ
jgi:hypothetical protein